jgi:hypothetical protein
VYAPKTYVTVVLDESGSMKTPTGGYVEKMHTSPSGSTYPRSVPVGPKLWEACVTSLQHLIDRMLDSYRPEQGEIMVRIVTFGSGARQQMGWTPLANLAGVNIDRRLGFGNGGNTAARAGLWQAINGVAALNDGAGMELEAASVIVYFTDGGDNAIEVSDQELRERIEALRASGQWTFVAMYCGEPSPQHGPTPWINMKNQTRRWSLDPAYCREFGATDAEQQWEHLADQMLSYLDHRAEGAIDDADLVEAGE